MTVQAQHLPRARTTYCGKTVAICAGGPDIVSCWDCLEQSSCVAGVIPFIALAPPIAAAIPFAPADLVANAALLQLGYGASILSFLGGVHWAMAMAEYGGALSLCCKLQSLQIF